MGLRRSERKALARIEHQLCLSDPQLSAMLEGMVRRQSRRRKPASERLPRRKPQAVHVVLVLLGAVVIGLLALSVVLLGHTGEGAVVPAAPCAGAIGHTPDCRAETNLPR